MSLRDSYFNGSNGIQQQMDAAFQSGIAYVGVGANDISTLALGDRSGSNLAAGSGNPGFYFTYATPSANYVMWIYESGELAPSVAGTLVKVTLLGGDSSTMAASKIAAAMNSIPSAPFAAMSNANVVTMQNSVSGVVILPVSAGTLGGTSAVAQVQAGIAPTGQYSPLQQALQNAAAAGQQDFRLVTVGTGDMNGVTLRACNGNNLALRSFFAGIYYALAGQNIYNYQVQLILDISSNAGTNVIFKFRFAHRFNNAPVNLDPLTFTNTSGFIGCGPNHQSGGSCGCGY